MKIAQYGTAIVVMHVIVHGLHGFAHWLLLGSMAGSLLSAIYNHHLVISPDHVSQVSFEGFGLLFQVTAYLMLIVGGLGCWISGLALRTIQSPEKAI